MLQEKSKKLDIKVFAWDEVFLVFVHDLPGWGGCVIPAPLSCNVGGGRSGRRSEKRSGLLQSVHPSVAAI